MDQSAVFIVHLKDKVVRRYSGLCSNDEVDILMWLHQQGFDFGMISGVESHDIGDQDYFHGSKVTKSIDEIAAFVEELYGEWSLNTSYHGIPIRVEKHFPNIYHGFSFTYPRMAEEAMSLFFSEFQEKYCYHDIKIRHKTIE